MSHSHKLKFLINSNKNNEHIVLNKLINSFYNQNANDYIIENTDILVVLGGSSHIYFEKRDKYCVLGIPHNSIDFTALIAVIEHVYTLIDHNFLIPDYWFYLHDTCELGPSFLKLLKPHIDTLYLYNYCIKPLTYIKSMNIGIYKYTFLLNKKNMILQLRSSDYQNNDQIQYFKKLGVSAEDFLFKYDYDEHSYKHSFTPHYMNDRIINLEDKKIIYENSNTLRITEYFPVLDFYKYKANWELKNIYDLNP